MLSSADPEHWLQRSISCLKGLMTVINAKAGQLPIKSNQNQIIYLVKQIQRHWQN